MSSMNGIKKDRLLVYGYGNPGRGDDGLGPALAIALEGLALPHTDVESNYQLEIQDATRLAGCAIAIFVDATTSGPEPFSFDPICPFANLGFSSHHLTPTELLWLGRSLFSATTQGYLLAIRGYEWREFAETMSSGAARNLIRAVEFVSRAVEERRFDDYVERYGSARSFGP